MVGGTSFPPRDSKSGPWSNEQKTKATPKPSTKGKAKPEARCLEGSGFTTRPLEVSLDNADTVIERGPLKPAFGLSGDVHTSQTCANEQTRLSSCHGD